MHRPNQIDETLRRARSEWPPGLPRGFADAVMQQVARYRPPPVLASPGPFALTGIAAIIAAAISLLTPVKQSESVPPTLTVFSGQPERSPFINP